MTYPTKPATAFDYVTFQAGSPTTPLPANQVAGDLANHKTSIDAIVEFSKLVQRSDGNLQNGIVRPESLSSGVLSLLPVGVVFRGAWLTATAYILNNIVSQSGNNYICIVAHTSGVFATDLAAGKWQLADTGFDPTANITFSGTDTFSGPVTHSGAETFTGAVDMTGGTPTVATKAVGNSTTAPASTAFVQAAVGKVNVQVFTANGTYTPIVGMVNCIIECWGGGGGGGGATDTGSLVAGAAGGGAGSYSRKLSTAAAIGVSKAVTIGAAGTAGVAGNNAGGNGGDTSVGSLCVGKGGSGGAGTAGALAGTVSTGGAGGVAGTGDVTTTGAPGASGIVSSAYLVSGGGGSSSVGGGGPGTMGQGAVSAGNAGTGRASGGGGAASSLASNSAAGGAGTAGYVVITEFCNQ